MGTDGELLLLNRRFLISEICRNWEQEQFQPEIRGHALTQLEGEGSKRLISFLFEPLLLRALAASLPAEQYSTGWVLAFDPLDGRIPRYWFRLVFDGDQPNRCDNELIDFLLGADCRVIVAKYIPNAGSGSSALLGATIDASGRADYRPLTEVLAGLLATGRPRGHTLDPRAGNEQHRRAAIDIAGHLFTADELVRLSVSRIFINCYLQPWFGRQPSDIDAVVLTDQDLAIVEFKRKYPMRSGRYGLDIEPHCMMADWLQARSVRFANIVLNDPLWDKDTSAIQLLEQDSPTAAYARWLGAWVTPETYTGRLVATFGDDSGMGGQERQQRQIDFAAYADLGTGLVPDPRRFARFLLGQGGGTRANFSDLVNDRSAARATFGLPPWRS